MIKIERLPAPDWLTENWEQWGKDYEAKDGDFTWRVGPKKKKELTDLLKSMTLHHCSYCDNFPMGRRRIKDTIDHFRPKEKYKLIAYQWENLFICCHYCQERNDKFDDNLLKPDEDDYDFDRYFEFDFKTFEITPNRIATKTEQERAQITIDLFRLNGKEEDKNTEEDCRIERERIYNKFITEEEPDIDDYPFRFMFT